MRRWAKLALVVWALGLTACASHTTETSSIDVVTPSDEPTAHRRARLRVELASAYLQRGQADVALDEAKQSLHALATYAPAHQVKGLAYMALGQPVLAKRSFDEALQLAPDDADLLHNMGWWYCGQGDYAAADGWFDRALKQGAGARTWLGKALCAQRGQNPQAAAYFAQAYALSPSDPQVVLGWAEYAWGHNDGERVHAVLAPFNDTAAATASSLWLHAKALHRLGDTALAERAGQRLKASFPNSPQAQAFERKLWNE